MATTSTFPIIASIDPGQSTGYAVARLQVEARRVLLRRKILGTSTTMQHVLETVRREECTYVVIEEKASNGSSMGTGPYDVLRHGLEQLGYRWQQGFYLMPQHLHTVSPGVWKPFMKATSVDRGKWSPHSSHESDAMQLLYYIVKINHMNKEVRYA